MENLLGGFTCFRKIEKEELDLFDKALQGMVGVGRTPLAVATQIVNGTNFAFLSYAKGVYPDAEAYNDITVIYKPINGEPIVKEVKKVKIM